MIVDIGGGTSDKVMLFTHITHDCFIEIVACNFDGSADNRAPKRNNCTVKVSSEETEEALHETTVQIVETIHSVLEKTLGSIQTFQHFYSPVSVNPLCILQEIQHSV